MNVVDKIIEARKSLNGRQVDYNEIIKVDEIEINKKDNVIMCSVQYTIEVNGGDDEYWDSEEFEISRLLNDEEMLRIGGINQYDYDSGIKKYTYYDINEDWRNAEKVRTTEI